MVAILIKRWREYRVAVATTAVAFVVTLLTGSWGDRTALALHLAAVLVSACFGGVKAGALATLLSAVALDFQQRLAVGAGRPPHDADYLTSLLLFVALGLLVSYLTYESVQALRSAARLHDTLEGLADAVLVTDRRGQVAFLNRAVRSLTGWLSADAVGRPAESVFALAEEQGRHQLRQCLARPQPLAAGGRLRGRDGAERAVEFSARPHQDGGLLLVFREAAGPRQDAEPQRPDDRIAALAACAPVGLLLLDRDGRCLYSNGAYRQAFGFSLEDGFEGCRSVHPEDRQAVAEWKAAAQKGEACAREFRVWDGDGRVRWVRLRSEVARAEAGEAVGHVGVLEDITESKNLESALGEQRKHVEAERQRSAALEQARAAVQQQLTERQRAEEAMRRGHAEEQAAWEQEADRLRRLLEEAGGSAGELTAARQQAAALEVRLAASEKNEAESAKQLADARQKEAALRQRAGQWQQQEADLRRQLTEAQQEAAGLRQQLEEWRGKESGLGGQLEEWRQQEAALTEQAAAAQQQAAALRRQLEEAHQRDGAARKQFEELQHRETAVRQQLDELQAERGRTEEPLRRKVGWLTRCLENLGAGVVAWEEGSEAPWINPAARGWLGVGDGPPPAGLIGQHVQMLRPEERSPLAADETPFARAGRGEAFEDVEILLAAEGNGHRFLAADGARLHDADGRPLGFVVTLHDVTEHKHAAGKFRDLYQTERRRAEEERGELRRAAEEERAEWRQRLATADEACGRAAFLAEVGRALAASLDPDGTLKGLAGLAVPRLGTVCVVRRVADGGAAVPVAIAVERDGGTHVWDGGDGAGPAEAGRTLHAGKASPDAAVEEAARALAAAGLAPVEAGAALTVALDADGRPALSLLFARREAYSDSDVSLAEEFAARAALALTAARRHREACLGRERLSRRLTFLRGVLGSLGEGVCALDRDERVIFLNPAAERLLGRPEGELFGRKLDEVLPLPAAGSLLRTLSERPLLCGEAAAGERALDCTVTALTEKDACKGAVVALRDATERRAREAELRRRLEEAVASARGGEGWLARLAARLRPEVDAARRTAPEDVAAQVRRLASLVDGLDVAARLGRGDVTLRPRSVDLCDVVSAAAEVCEPLLRARGQHLTVALPLRPECFEADGPLVSQALAQLLENAARHSGTGAEIRLTAERAGGAVVLRVRDVGAGIAAEEVPRLEALCARTRRFCDRGDGLGMGLAVARGVAELHGGRLTVRSDGPGRGSEFVLHLPVEEPQPVAA